LIQKTYSFNNRKDTRPVFANRECYEEYRKSFRERVLPALKKYKEAHIKSVEKSMTHFVR